MTQTSLQVYTFRTRSLSLSLSLLRLSQFFSLSLWGRSIARFENGKQHPQKMWKNIDTNKSEVQHVLNFVTNLVIYIKIKKSRLAVFLLACYWCHATVGAAAVVATSFNLLLINFHWYGTVFHGARTKHCASHLISLCWFIITIIINININIYIIIIIIMSVALQLTIPVTLWTAWGMLNEKAFNLKVMRLDAN